MGLSRWITQRARERIKRGVDVVGASVGLVAAAPVMAAAAGAIWVKMGRPVLFVQPRPGKDAVVFELMKFRTMTTRKPGQGYDQDAVRITPLGAFLRKTSIDELPTLFNVLRGDMSLVGPRPLLVEYLERYSPEQARRHEVKPGVTGHAQVNGRNALSWEEKFALDVWYVDNWSLKLDAQILLRTVWAVLRREGISPDDHAVMPVFEGAASSSTPETVSERAVSAVG